MKRVICIILCVVMLVCLLPLSVWAGQKPLYVSKVEVVSSECGTDSCRVYIYEDKCYMYVDDIVRYTRSSYKLDGDKLTVTHGTRKIEIDLKKNKLTDDTFTADIETLRNGDSVVLHALPMLTFLGAHCGIDDGKLSIYMPQATLWEGLVRTGKENVYTVDTFGSEDKQKSILLANFILKMLESGIGTALTQNHQREAIVNALQVDPLKYTGATETLDAATEKQAAILSASDITIDSWDVAGSVISPVVDAVLYGIDKKSITAEKFNKVKRIVQDIKVSSDIGGNEMDVICALLSDINALSKCGSDSLNILPILIYCVPEESQFYYEFIDLQSVLTDEKHAAVMRTALTTMQCSMDNIVDLTEVYKKACNGGKLLASSEAFFEKAGLMSLSIDISTLIFKLAQGFLPGDAFARADAQTASLYLTYLKSDMTVSMGRLGESIRGEKYGNYDSLEKYRLMNVFYYKTLIAQYEQLKALLVGTYGEDAEEIAEDMVELDKDIDLFARQLYYLSLAEVQAYPDLSKLAENNEWDVHDIIGNNAEELSGGLSELNYSGLTPVLSGVKADSIQYYDFKETRSYSVIERDGKFGLIDYNGKIILQPTYDNIFRGSGWFYEYLICADKDGNYSGIIDKNGKVSEGGNFPGGGIEPSVYWYGGEVVILNAGKEVVPFKDFAKEWLEKYNRKIDLTADNLAIRHRTWTSNKLFPIKRISGYTNRYGNHEPHFKTHNFAMLDMNTYELVTDFIYENIDDYTGFSCRLLAVRKGGKWGYIDENANVVVDFKYDPYKTAISFGQRYESIYAATNGYITVTQNGKWGLLDTKGNTVLDVNYDGISQVNPDGYFWLKENGSWTLYQIDR